MKSDVILTGLRANGELHLGNYIGAVLPMVRMQQQKASEYQINMFIPDLHSFTTPIDHSLLQDQIMQDLRIFVAAGLDLQQPDTYIYRQSRIPAHSELTVILNNFTYFGELSRMTQFKDKGAAAHDEPVSVGLFDYPVLMAADILLYNARWVPVGEDQRQHLELTRDIGIRLNNKFGELFTIPEDWDKQLAFAARDSGLRIRSLRNPEKKMSKSIEDPAGTILLSDAPSEAAKKIMSATTDSLGEIRFDLTNRPGISNLLQISAALSGLPLEEVRQLWEGKTQYGDLKKHTADLVVEFLAEFQTHLAEVDTAVVTEKLEHSETAMRHVANDTLHKVQRAVGLRNS